MSDNRKTILGQKNRMRNGMECTVIADRGAFEIDVLFEDGTIVTNRSRQAFKKGKIANPTLGKHYTMTINKSIVGQTRTMKCGMDCTVINDRGAYDIDVQFEDGTIATNKYRAAFKRGEIANPTLGKFYTMSKNTSIIGQTLTMNCGMDCTVIEDRGSKHIDVQFEDGTIVTNVTRTSFRERTIANPTLGKGYALSKKTNIVGQTRMMNCGLECTVIYDRGSRDIDVQFEDGTIVSSRRDIFLQGLIKNPNYDPTSILGQKRRMNCGQMCEVIEDKGSEQIAVKFEDGYIRFNCSRANFFKGKINNPNIATSQSLPQTIVYHFVKQYFSDAIANYRPDWLKNEDTGLNLEIDIWIPGLKTGIEYDGYKWHSEETDLSEKKYKLFLNSQNIDSIITILEKGSIAHISSKHVNYQLDYTSYGKTRGSNDSEYSHLLKQLETVIKQILHDLGVDCDVSINDELIDQLYFEPRMNMPLSVGKRKGVGKRDLQYLKSDDCNLKGLSNEMECGMECTVIEDNGFNNITVEFEDGTIVENLRRTTFIKQIIINPNICGYSFDKNSIIGQTNTMNCGMECTVIEDYGHNDITVQFIDGMIVRHRTRVEFRKRTILNPNLKKEVKPKQERVSLLGTTRMMNCGMECTVIEDYGYDDITVRFEDETTVHHRTRYSFRKGSIRNPNLNKGINPSKSMLGVSKIMNCGMECIVIADRGALNIDVRFKDGTIVTNKSRSQFRKGSIPNPKLGKTYTRTKNTSIVGQTRTMNCGMECTVIAERSSNDIDVRFEDGTIVTNINRTRFREGTIANPTLGKGYALSKRTSIVGQTRMMNCGMECTVIEDKGARDITVQFVDGTTVNSRRDRFSIGRIKNPNYDSTSILGLELRMNNGEMAKVIEDKGSENITVRFNDGTVVCGIARANYKKGKVGKSKHKVHK